MKPRRYIALLLFFLWMPTAQAHDRAPVVIGVVSAYQSEVINNKVNLFVEGIAATVRRPAHVIALTTSAESGVAQLLSTHRHAVLFVPQAMVAGIDPATRVLLAQTWVSIGLYARPGKDSLTDLRRVSMPRFVGSAVMDAELHAVNPALELVPQDIGTGQLRALVSGSVDGVVMSDGVYSNLAQPLRSRFVRRFAFAHRQKIIAMGSSAFSTNELAQLRQFLLVAPANVSDQLHQTFGISGFEAVEAAEIAPARR